MEGLQTRNLHLVVEVVCLENKPGGLVIKPGAVLQILEALLHQGIAGIRVEEHAVVKPLNSRGPRNPAVEVITQHGEPSLLLISEARNDGKALRLTVEDGRRAVDAAGVIRCDTTRQLRERAPVVSIRELILWVAPQVAGNVIIALDLCAALKFHDHHALHLVVLVHCSPFLLRKCHSKCICLLEQEREVGVLDEMIHLWDRADPLQHVGCGILELVKRGYELRADRCLQKV
mmetsp:Transcript_105715/g.264694  ORF Transcript_105715/g.264694 Transcript_105715/m.264694 type:complete len:232 (+) Transcript_105715:1772-2467(+)